jgi:hypothetical protein
VPPSPRPPEFFVDRGLGRVVVADAIRERGHVVRTMAEVYGDREQQVADEEWLSEAGRRGWIVLTKDRRIRRRRPEIEAIARHGVSAFVLARGSLGAVAQADCFVTNLERIVEAAGAPGPCVYEVRPASIRRLWPHKEAVER